MEVPADTVIRAVVGARVFLAVFAYIPRETLAFTSERVASTVVVAVVVAKGDGAVDAFPAFVAFATVSFAFAVA